MRVVDLCSKNVVTATEDESLFKAAYQMRENHVGDVVVVRQKNGQRRPVGILTDRDIVTAMVAVGEDDFAETTVARAMSDVLIMAREDDDLVEILNNMQANGVRRVPVIDTDDNLVGIVTYDDILRELSGELAKLSQVVDAEVAREKQKRP
ncbi:CBS domain-containing protein [Persicimonas caeni]|uniref:CBS domain-containing protein n=1 Tax=Persicimonas caeni TaxID=2292766 RepID=A0A4Y6PZF5_PERCE|nr:CBS domain-containing protein [Persicimonas caeni]QDG53704.1 CBS domain-containing protein [Persicimonas caeni]QED34925.1 CBS domain-containing protein [Persicimonas caeni]